MEDANFAEQNYCNPAAFPRRDFSAQLNKQRLYGAPLNVGADRMSKDGCEGLLMLALHGGMVPLSSTTAKRLGQALGQLTPLFSGQNMLAQLLRQQKV
jgi:hypothetical protein